MAITVISAGGSIIVPDKPDPDFLSLFRDSMADYLSRHSDDKLIFVIGGGATARMYQEAAKKALGNADPDILDWIGIRTTHLNATFVKAAFSDLAPDDIVTDPTDENLQFTVPQLQVQLIIAPFLPVVFPDDLKAKQTDIKISGTFIIGYDDRNMVDGIQFHFLSFRRRKAA